MKITVYSKPECVQCHWTKKQLDKMELVYDDVDVTASDEAADAVRSQGFGDHPTLPVVVVSNDQRVVKWAGFHIDRIRGIRETGNY